MVKERKFLREGGEPSKVPGVAIAGGSRMCRLRQRYARKAVLKMLAQERPEVETEGEPGDDSAKGGDILKGRQCGSGGNNGAVTPGSYANGEGSKEFLSTGRTGRRNAMPDILGHHADTGTADLSTRLEALTTESVDDQPGTSGLGQSDASTSQQQMG